MVTLLASKSYPEVLGGVWSKVFVPGGRESPVVKDYRVHGIPSLGLIGPDGKVLAKDLRGEGIKAAVGAALAKK